MQFFANIPISRKLPAIMTLLVLIAVAGSMILSAIDLRSASETQAKELMQSLVQSRGNQLEDQFQLREQEINVMARRTSTVKAMAGFASSWDMFGESAAGKILELYVTNNPFGPEERGKYDSAGDFSFYTGAHASANPEFRSTLGLFGYQDIYLIDMHGNVVYSVTKGADFTTSLETGPYKDSGLARLYKSAKSLKDGQVAFEDFSAYGTGNGALASFLGRPVFNEDGTAVGVLAYQFGLASINTITTAAEGLGATGDLYLVGPDHIMRSESRFATEQTALVREVSTPAVDAALADQAGEVEGIGLNGAPVLSAYFPLQVYGQTWAVITEKDSAEVFDELSTMLFNLGIGAVVVLTVIMGAGILLSRSISVPLVRVIDAMHEIADGELDTHVSYTGRRDEVGRIASALDDFRVTLQEAEKTNMESQFRGAAFQASKSAMMMVDLDLNIIHLNEAVLELMRKYQDIFSEHVQGFDIDKVLGGTVTDFHPDAIGARVAKIMRDRSKLPYHASIAMGDVRLELTISAVDNEKGEHIGYVSEWVDASQTYLNTALLGAMDENQLKAEFRADGTFIVANTLFEQAVGDVAQVANITALSPELADVFEHVRAGEAVYDLFSLPCSHDGAPVKIDGGFAPVKDPRGNILRVVLIGNDVTEAQRKIAEAETARATMQAAQAKVVDALRNGLEQLAEGNLTVSLNEAFSDDYEQLRNDFNKAVDGLLSAMRGVIENADLIQGEAAEISSAADDLSGRTEKQAATLEETAAALDELTSSVTSAAEAAAHANDLVDTARKDAEASGEVVREAVEAMSAIETSSQQIGKITSVIDDIAFQTNLLALNAGVEAARAGEAGRGFAVVASEVRALAQRSSEAAREINGLISASGAQVKRGVELVDQAGDALKGIVESVMAISQNVSGIAVSSREQSSGLAEINEAVNQLDHVTQQNAAMFEETTAASHALTREAETLTQTMGQFQTGQGSMRKGAEVVTPTFPAGSTSAAGSEAKQPVQAPVAAKAAPKAVAASASSQSTPTFDDDDGWDEF